MNVYECFEENGTAYYVMDLIVGESLQSKLKREGALPEKLVSSYLNQSLSALMVVHEKNILNDANFILHTKMVRDGNRLRQEFAIDETVRYGMGIYFRRFVPRYIKTFGRRAKRFIERKR